MTREERRWLDRVLANLLSTVRALNRRTGPLVGGRKMSEMLVVYVQWYIRYFWDSCWQIVR
jgi:hypothetical protein